MFSKGPRFNPHKVSDVPGPNSYNVVTDSQLDDYKRGAFLEKTERFTKDKDHEVPGPGTYDADPKKAIKSGVNEGKRVPSQTLGDRYATLQRKVDDLERVHNDGKKAHQLEVERLKAELARSQKLVSEQTDRAEKQKKQIDLLESRIQDLKKTSASDQIEIKDLRVKLRMSENEKTQLTTKQGEANETKKSLQSLETKRREELREKDRQITQLEKALNGEKKRKEAAEAKLQEIGGRADQELQAARLAAQKLEDVVATSHAEAKQAQETLASLRQASSHQEEDLLAQLEHYRNLVGLVAEEYGHLARGTVSLTSYTRLRQENASLVIQVSRLERKLANSVAQVDELAVLIRQINDQKTFLSEQLRQVDQEIAFYQSALLDRTLLESNHSDELVFEILKSMEQEHAASLQDVHAMNTTMAESFSELYRVTTEGLLLECALVRGQLKCEQRLSDQHSASLTSALASHEAIAARLECVEEEKNVINMEMKAVTDSVELLRSSSDSLARRAAEAEKKLADATAHNETTLKKERDVVRRLTEAMQKMRTTEDGLRAEIEQLTTELTDAERYQEAYYSLSEEVGSLVARNQLAEEEAQRLSKFNAEILGHNNPAQRIMYVDRIRRELAEAKHKLVMLGREQEAAIAINDDLQHELDMYKSIMVSADNKPRTTLTRVTRPPLVNLTRSLNVSVGGSLAISASKSDDLSGKGSVQRVHALETIPGDMTIDEIM
ncbi:hypothetical protein H2248_005156 [Termitomyces sp. 'cryptogamus']|nr:hypothetical protein H2248_005156 [Termitomyces sp. 'cryptogamus']